MKRVFLLGLAVMLCISLCACGKSKAVKNVEPLINAIGSVSVDSESAIVAAENAYARLTEKNKEAVENADVLLKAREAYETALREKKLEDMYTAVSGEWINVNDMDHYIFNQDGSGTHDGKNMEFAIDQDALTLSVLEGVTSPESREFAMDLEGKVPKLVLKNAATYYVEAENYDAVAQQIRDEYTEILTGYEYWSNTKGLNYIMFDASGGGFFLISGITLGMTWEWVDNNTIKAVFDYSGTKYSNVLTIINTSDGPRLINDQNVVMFTPKNKLK